MNKKDILFKTAWMAVVLGLAMEILFLCVAACFGKNQTIQMISADLVQKISWSTFVCVGVAVGSVIAKGRAQLTGIMGFLSAPIAFHVAKVLHKSTSQALNLIPAAMAVPSVLVLTLIKALEYAALGYLLGWIADKEKWGLRVYALIGFCIGLIFGGTIVALMILQSPQAPSVFSIISRSVNEIIFPVGCSVVLYCVHRFIGSEAS